MNITEKIDRYLNESRMGGILKGKKAKELVSSMRKNFSKWDFKTNLEKLEKQGFLTGKINLMDYGMVFETNYNNISIKESKRGEFYELYENGKYVGDFDPKDSVYLREQMLKIIWNNKKRK